MKLTKQGRLILTALVDAEVTAWSRVDSGDVVGTVSDEKYKGIVRDQWVATTRAVATAMEALGLEVYYASDSEMVSSLCTTAAAKSLLGMER